MKFEINQSITLTINSRKYWNETGIEIQSGQEYQFTASGTWKDLFKKSDADGYTTWYMSLFNRLKRSKNNNWFALIGSLNKNDVFLIGKTNKILFPQSGRLYCYANDVKGFYFNNSGKISLTIMRVK